MRLKKLLTGTIISGVCFSIFDLYGKLDRSYTDHYMHLHMQQVINDKKSPGWVKNQTLSAQKSAVQSFEVLKRVVSHAFNYGDQHDFSYINTVQDKIKQDCLDNGMLKKEYLQTILLAEMVKLYRSAPNPNSDSLFEQAYNIINNGYKLNNNTLFTGIENNKGEIKRNLKLYWQGLHIDEAIDGLEKYEKEINENAVLLRLKALSRLFGVKTVQNNNQNYYIIDVSFENLQARLPQLFSNMSFDAPLNLQDGDTLLGSLQDIISIPQLNIEDDLGFGNYLKNTLYNMSRNNIGQNVLRCLKLIKQIYEK